ncbi:sensor histidine kinase [Catenulispora yoronensis]|uniref:sensor histidine kinase n=1 Tax=Catenulispora yoronensis TaxID=450799 RepID=UPI0031D8F599
MSRLYAWIQRHPKLTDSLPAVFLLLSGLGTVAAQDGATTLNRVLVAPLVVAISAPLVIRRRWPIGGFAVASVAAFLGFFGGRIAFNVVDAAFLIYLYTVAAYRPRRWSIPAMLLTVAGALIQLALVKAFNDSTDCDTLATDLQRTQCRQHVGQWGSLGAFNWGTFLVATVFVGGLIGLFWVMGDSMRYRREYYVRLEDRAERLERERDAQAQIAAASERARIARELHDVVAHNVSVMVVQADGATYALDQDPEATRKALLAIAQTGRTALTEMRRMLGVLRSADDAGTYAPQPGIEQLGDLLEQVRSTGLPVTLTVEGVPREMPTGLALAVYRIVQESLTNTRKHGGPDVRASVGLVYIDDSLLLRIVDNGRGEAAPTDGLGHGLVGMRERVAVFGGTLVTGPHVSGGYAVEAILPFPAPDSAGGPDPDGAAGAPAEPQEL